MAQSPAQTEAIKQASRVLGVPLDGAKAERLVMPAGEWFYRDLIGPSSPAWVVTVDTIDIPTAPELDPSKFNIHAVQLSVALLEKDWTCLGIASAWRGLEEDCFSVLNMPFEEYVDCLRRDGAPKEAPMVGSAHSLTQVLNAIQKVSGFNPDTVRQIIVHPLVEGKVAVPRADGNLAHEIVPAKSIWHVELRTATLDNGLSVLDFDARRPIALGIPPEVQRSMDEEFYSTEARLSRLVTTVRYRVLDDELSIDSATNWPRPTVLAMPDRKMPWELENADDRPIILLTPRPRDDE